MTGCFQAPGEITQYIDPETGLQYLRARYYDPNTAQFLTPDPLFAVTGERYGYAGNDSLNQGDPSGLYWGESFVHKAGHALSSAGRAVARVADDVAAAPGHVAHDVYEHRTGLTQALAYTVTAAAIGTCIVASAGTCAGVVLAGVAARGLARAQDVGLGNSWRADLTGAAMSLAYFGVGYTPDWAGSLEGTTPGIYYLGRALIGAPDTAMFAGDLATGGDALGDRFDTESDTRSCG